MIRSEIAMLVLAILLSSCSKDTEVKPTKIPAEIPSNEIIRIPIVVHVVNYSPAPFEISDEKIKSQIEVLNQDYRRQNPDHTNAPSEFIDLVADVGIEFHLAEKDPEGNLTSGIVRTSSEVTGWDGKTIADETSFEDLKLYNTNQGGQDAWPRDQYLNIWIADLSDRHGNLVLAGYAQFPDCDPRIDGVVIDPRAFGTLPPIAPNLNYGRTATHEIGHWLSLLHIYGKDGDCEEGDMVDDTPVQLSQYTGNPTYPQSSCGSNDMFMNFMDRVYDESMIMFTKGQRERIRSIFNDGGSRRQLYLNTLNNN
ncbi:zinc metalloprotease [Reichenbachiella versicolor]|uniref:zinc metalloprotease n=1 Tax=Reichenbachiella versicolor TaxID=1821036 RepID=UPI0013A5780A|nr:zinc metalloprotease [Reichenbachiella versicolor]